MLTLAVGSLLGGAGLLASGVEGFAVLPVSVLGLGVWLLVLTLKAIGWRMVDRAILNPSAWVRPSQAVEPLQEIDLGLAFELPDGVGLEEVRAILRQEEIRPTQDGFSLDTTSVRARVLRESPRLANTRREFRGAFEVPGSAQPTFSRHNGRARRWKIVFEVKLEGYPTPWRAEHPLEVILTERPDLDTRAVLAFEREVEAWLPEFVEEALRNPAPYDEEQRYAIERVASRRRIR
jgi:hypothetical protein